MSVGAISVLFLLDKGLSLSDCASLKLVQVATFLTCDIPLGLFLNKIGPLKSMKWALVLAITGCLGYLLSQSFLGFLIAEFFTALSISIWPAASSAYGMDALEGGSYSKNTFFHQASSAASLSTFLFGVAGGLIYIVQIQLPYFLILIAMSVGLLITLKLKSEVKSDVKSVVISPRNFHIKHITKYFKLWPVVSVLIIIQFFSQMQLHYWQPLLRDLNLNGPQWIFSAAFGCITLIMAFSSYLYSRVCEKEAMKNMRTNLFLLLILGISASLLFYTYTYVSAFLLIGLLYSVSKIASTSVSVQIQESIDSNERLAVIKTVSWAARLGMVLSLSIISILLDKFSVKEIFVIFGLIMIVFSMIYLLTISLDVGINHKENVRIFK
ncbi:MAG: MFS transporter [Deltaproteobacteria bacterium]|nr:MFS transporter [Deltaproteobacteria bacterium]